MEMSLGGTYTKVTDVTVLAPVGAPSSGRVLREVDSRAGAVTLGVWRAEPGIYEHPGNLVGESFVVVEGDAVLALSDGSEYSLEPGTFVTIPDATPSSITVASTLVKVSLTVR